MALHKLSLCFFLMVLVTLISCTHARTFEVGGKDGWTTNPSDNYNSWSGRLRFLINDTLHFKYDGGVDSVLVVNKGDYDGCNINNPITKLDGGDSTFKLDRSGPFYFISGNKSNCDQGQKMTVVVLALRIRSPPPGAATPPSPGATPPSAAMTPPPGAATPPSPTATPPSAAMTPPPGAATPTSPTATPPSPAMTPPSPTVSPSLPPSPSTGTGSPESSVPPALSPSGTPTLTPPGGAPALTPSGSSPGPGGAAGGPGGAAGGPGAAAGGPGAAAGGPGGAPGQSPGGSNPADTNSPSAATRPLSGTIMASFVTMIFGLWLIS